MTIQIRDVSVTEEKRIIIGLVTSTEYTNKIQKILELDYFTNRYLEKIAKWCLSFYDKHKKAPGKHIKDIFEVKAAKLKSSEAELIHDLLKDLSKQYDPEEVNVEYLLQTTEHYIRKRELEITASNVEILKEQGKIEEAEEQIQKFNKITIKLDESVYVNPGNVKQREEIYIKRDEKEQTFFSLPGDVGKFLGNMKKGDVVGITAAAKRGKSFLLTNMLTQAVMSRKKTLFWSIEMTDTEMLARVDQSFVPMVTEGMYEKGMYFYPVFDCLMNQTGECAKRKSKVIVRDDENNVDLENRKHKPCIKCRDSKTKFFKYKPVIWDKLIKRKMNDRFTVRKEMKGFVNLLDQHARIIVRPKYSLTYDLMLQDLAHLEHYHNFIPEIILLDYIDILQISSFFDDYKLEDQKWKLMQTLAGITQCLIVTPTQGNKVAHEAALLKSTDQAGFYGKNRHVNLMIGINQTPLEKRQGIWRLSILDGRSVASDAEDTCMILQDLKAGQMHLDSYWANKYARRY